jgi:2-dehydro-3-deoxy-D-gluconate 5-dehydrogenase
MFIPNLLKGQVAIVTGGGTGLGLAIAKRLGELGARIVIGSRNSENLEKGSAELRYAGLDPLTVQVDVRNPEQVDEMVQRTIRHFGRIDILVNNAGIIRRADSIEFTEKDWDDVMNVNLKSTFFLSQAVAKRMLEDGAGGKIINIASLLSFQGGIRIPSYTASKSGLAGLTRLLACEWAAKGINVNAIAPGYFVTNNTEALRDDPKRSSEILGRIPAGRWGDPADIGGAAVFLASSAADYIHGVVLPVDGGWLAR